MNRPLAQEVIPGSSGLSNVANIPSGRLEINETTFVPRGFSSVGFAADPLPSQGSPLPPADNSTCSLTSNIAPLGYSAGTDTVVPFKIGDPTIIPNNLSVGEIQLRLTKQERNKQERLVEEKISEIPVGVFYGMSFSIFDEEEILKTAVVEVSNPGTEGDYTVNDKRFGPVSGNQVCPTCINVISKCPGHSGYIRLNSFYSPDIYRQFIVRVLNSICLECRKVLLTEDDMKRHGLWYWAKSKNENGGNELRKKWRYFGEDRLRKISELTLSIRPACRQDFGPKVRRCLPNPEYKRDLGGISYKYPDNKNDKWKRIYLEQIRKVLEDISDEDSVILGFDPPAHPKRLVMKYLPVLPLCARSPLVKNGQTIPDGLTNIYHNIVTNNVKLGEPLKFTEKIDENRGPFPDVIIPSTPNRESIVNKLHNEINNLIFGSANKENEVSMKKLLQGKRGLPRESMMGKRGDYSGRAVLTPGPELEYGQIGLPASWSRTLTVAVEVTFENVEALTKLMEMGQVVKINIGGKEGYQRTINPDQPLEYHLKPGDTIERALRNGDYVAFGRNPSLHKQSLMGYEVILYEGSTIRLPIHTTPHHGADYDGDEGNVWPPDSRSNNSMASEAELRTVMNARYCIVSGQDNRPLAGFIFNDITASYKMTRPETMIRDKTWQDCMEILARNGNASQLTTLEDRLNKYKVKLRSGRALFSALLPEDFYYRKGTVVITEGILVRGIINKSIVGPVHRSIAQLIFKNYDKDQTNHYAGAERAARFLSDGQFVMKRWLEDEPVTTSLADCYPKKDPETEINHLYEITHNQEKIELMSWDLCRKIMERSSEYANFETLIARLERYNQQVAEEDKIPLVSGRALVSLILPDGFNLEMDNQIIISNGIFVKEITTKAEATEIRKEIIRKFAREYDSNRAGGFIKDLRTLLTECLSISLETGKHYKIIDQEIERTKSIIEMYGPKLNDPIEGKRAREIIQAQLNKVNVIGDETLQKNLDPGNNIWLMSVGAGTKGTSVNINQMLSMVGLQGADLISGGETAIYSTMGDPDPVDYGLVRSNYREGLNPKELFLNAIDTRRALVGVSIGTAGPGALSRIIIKNMEGLLIQRDGTVRLQGQQIVQSIYGYTGFNPERMINITFPEGQIPFFIDIASTAERINGNLGYIPDDILEM